MTGPAHSFALSPWSSPRPPLSGRTSIETSAMASPSLPIEDFISSLPKAELHLHLEGAIDRNTLWELAQRQNSALASQGPAAAEALFQTRDFPSFIEAFKTVCLHLAGAADYELVTYRVLKKLAGQNVRYAEITLAAGVMVWRQQDIAAMFAGVEAGARQAREEFGIRAQWILDGIRHFGPDNLWPVARAAVALRDRGVAGLGIGGDEAGGPAEWFAEVFKFARGEGLHVVAHAGETVGPESVWSALRVLRAERIGHGLTAVRDPELVDYLSEHQVPVEICLTSNLRTGGIRALGEHPIREYYGKGLQISLHTDDPALFGTDLHREYLLAHRTFGFTREQLRELAMNGFRAAFLSEQEKEIYLAEFHPDTIQ